ncbi:MAG: glycosyltransferase family 4 protein [Acidimicrobiia bacterium]|nr:glycosyltransferase family 4 protein [Acidimicrobiia bacterium]
MRLLLLQDQVHLPSLGGGNKTTRMLMEQLARRGHECSLMAPALTTRAGPATLEEFAAEMTGRGIAPIEAGDVFDYEFRGVSVSSFRERVPEGDGRDAWRSAIAARIARWVPDWVIVSDDRHRVLLDAAFDAGARVCFLAQTVMHMPFGPDAARPSAQQAALVRRCHAVMAVGQLPAYLREHGGVEAAGFAPPVYGPGPFPLLGRWDGEFVTLVNPCVEKGVGILTGLAAARPDIAFAVVPTWGADAGLLAELAAIPNVCILPPADDIDDVLARTRILLAPSLWPEAFGLIVVEAMLRGIPAMASDVGGLPEAKQGVEFVLPVRPAERRDGVFASPPQDLGPWLAALDALVSDRERYARCSRDSRAAALRYVTGIGVEPIEQRLLAAGAA